MQTLTQWIPWIGGLGLVGALIIFLQLNRLHPGTDRMKDIAHQIYLGSMAFLRREYMVLVTFVIVVALLLGNFLEWNTAIAFLSGATCSVLAGFFGMQAATRANVRTAEAARSLDQGRAHPQRTPQTRHPDIP